MVSEVFDMKKFNKFKRLHKTGGNMKKSGLNLKKKEIDLFMRLINKQNKN
jgi:hypothetical protein